MESKGTIFVPQALSHKIFDVSMQITAAFTPMLNSKTS